VLSLDKGAEITPERKKINLISVRESWLLRAGLKRHRLASDESLLWKQRPTVGRPFSFRAFSWGTFPGLKAWAILFSPFGRLE
jgi:hypothetical protein